jgi:hypothetical protein
MNAQQQDVVRGSKFVKVLDGEAVSRMEVTGFALRAGRVANGLVPVVFVREVFEAGGEKDHEVPAAYFADRLAAGHLEPIDDAAWDAMVFVERGMTEDDRLAAAQLMQPEDAVEGWDPDGDDLTQTIIELTDAYAHHQDAYDDLAAYNAPVECYHDVARSQEREARDIVLRRYDGMREFVEEFEDRVHPEWAYVNALPGFWLDDEAGKVRWDR